VLLPATDLPLFTDDDESEEFFIMMSDDIVFNNFTFTAFEPSGDDSHAVDMAERYPGIWTAKDPVEVLDYYRDDSMDWDGSQSFEIPEYPGVTFVWTPEELCAVDGEVKSVLFTGMPIWNVFLADITGDGKPEIFSTYSFGSGFINDSVIAYDYSRGDMFVLSDRGMYDYSLSISDYLGTMMVTRSEYLNPDESDTMILAIEDGVLTI
jgi:hypothetical protein